MINIFFNHLFDTHGVRDCRDANETRSSEGVEIDDSNVDGEFDERFDDFSRGQIGIMDVLGFIGGAIGSLLGGFIRGLGNGLFNMRFNHNGRSYDIYSNRDFTGDLNNISKRDLKSLGFSTDAIEKLIASGIFTKNECGNSYSFDKEAAKKLVGQDVESLEDFSKLMKEQSVSYKDSNVLKGMDCEDLKKYFIGPMFGDKYVLDKDAIQADFPVEQYGEITTPEELKAAINKSRCEERLAKAQEYVQKYIEMFTDSTVCEKFKGTANDLIELFSEGDIDFKSFKTQIDYLGDTMSACNYKEEDEEGHGLNSMRAEAFIRATLPEFFKKGCSRIYDSQIQEQMDEYVNGNTDFISFARNILNLSYQLNS